MKKIICMLFCLLCFMPMVNAEETYEAMIGDVKYKTLQEAYDSAVDGNEIVLQKDIDGFTNSKTITLNLNGYQITGVVNNGDLTIKGAGKVYSNSKTTTGIVNNKNLTLSNITLETASSGLINNSSSLTLKEVTLSASTDSNNSNTSKRYINSSNGDASVTIESGTYNITDSNIQLISHAGKLVINSGSFTGIKGSTYISGGDITINNGTFNNIKIGTLNNITINNGNFINSEILLNNLSTPGVDNSVYRTSLTINSGTFVSDSDIITTIYQSTNRDIFIKGGTFTTTGNLVYMIGANTNKTEITGGTITAKGIYVASGSLVIGTNDNVVTKESPKLNVESITVCGGGKFEFYDGELILNEQLDTTNPAMYTLILPTGYTIKYDSNNNKYNAYLTEEVSEEPVTEEKDETNIEEKEDTTNDEVTEEIEKEETKKEKLSSKEIKQILLYVLIVADVACITTLIVYTFNKKRKSNKSIKEEK